MVSRAERNNNPGNLEASPWTRQQPGYVGSDGRFAIFDSMANGTAAQTSLLGSYIHRGYNTVSTLINRYGNDPGTADDASVANYIRYVAGRLGVGAHDTLSTNQATALQQAMSEFETGHHGSGVIGTTSASGGFSWRDLLGPIAGGRSPIGIVGDMLPSMRDLDPTGITGFIEDLFSGAMAARFTAVIVGIILIAVALIAFILTSDSGKQVVTQVRKVVT